MELIFSIQASTHLHVYIYIRELPDFTRAFVGGPKRKTFDPMENDA